MYQISAYFEARFSKEKIPDRKLNDSQMESQKRKRLENDCIAIDIDNNPHILVLNHERKA